MKLLAVLFLTILSLSAKKPNLVYILADDLGYGAHSGSAVCTPTRYGILTGRYAFRSRLKKGVLGGYSPFLIEEGRMTVGSFLQGQGYETAFIGKWHLGWDWAKKGKKKNEVDYTKAIRNGPKERGFTYSYGHCGSLEGAHFAGL